jgi:hypothetical protein
MRDEFGLPMAEQLGLELMLPAHFGGGLLSAHHFEHHPRFELGTELATLTHGCTLLLDLSYLISLPVQDAGRTTPLWAARHQGKHTSRSLLSTGLATSRQSGPVPR